MSPFLSVVTPVYGCEGCIRKLYERLVAVLNQITPEYEIIFVNDASPDNSWTVIKDLSSRDSKVKGVSFSRNFGQHYAITAGLDYAKGQWIVVMDCDLQDPPEEILKLHSKSQEGYDIVYGIADFRAKKNFLSNLLRKIYFRIYDLFAQNKFKTENLSFYIMSEKVKNSVIQLRESSRHISSLMRFVGFRITGIPVEHLERTEGKSAYTFMQRLNLAFTGIIAYSSVLLRLALYLGFSFSFLSFVGAVIIVIGKIFNYYNFPGWASIVTLILFSTGIILSFLGIIGIYMEKIYLEVKNRPLYIVSETLNTQ